MFDHYVSGSVGLLGTCLALKWTGHASTFVCNVRSALVFVHSCLSFLFLVFFSIPFNRHQYLSCFSFKRLCIAMDWYLGYILTFTCHWQYGIAFVSLHLDIILGLRAHNAFSEHLITECEWPKFSY